MLFLTPCLSRCQHRGRYSRLPWWKPTVQRLYLSKTTTSLYTLIYSALGCGVSQAKYYGFLAVRVRGSIRVRSAKQLFLQTRTKRTDSDSVTCFMTILPTLTTKHSALNSIFHALPKCILDLVPPQGRFTLTRIIQ